MAMFPEFDFDLEEEEALEIEEEITSTVIGRTPVFDFDKGCYVIKDGKIVECTQEEAIRQWVGFLIKTPAEKYEVYADSEFGTYIHNLIGWKDSSYVASEILRELEEKCVDNRAIAGIDNFTYVKENGLLHIEFAIITKNDEEVEVEVDV